VNQPIEPIVVQIEVRRGIQDAFRLFTEDIGGWWPVAGHAVRPDQVAAVVLEGRVGGRLYERWHDGGEADWGQVLAWEPPTRLLLTWRPNRARPCGSTTGRSPAP